MNNREPISHKHISVNKHNRNRSSCSDYDNLKQLSNLMQKGTYISRINYILLIKRQSKKVRKLTKLQCTTIAGICRLSVYNTLQTSQPQYLISILNHPKYHYSTRFANSGLNVPKTRTETGKSSFFC